ncbi:hypothetical protein Poli38472_001360 [Pythium oligandrum]|uniref:S-adenosyl-L-methionine-dependent methyltransferase n=1 Tax=Pythium oligandrum TaxID=41045 RepID=A0A8K1CTC8_PYTOL|nr:hypothetical protein Poli38472_001360 [Pythium oligandrum]|eukprot:TMW69204.1 hypothetical protein Poli38472_001360 [Pythium oligandrum]
MSSTSEPQTPQDKSAESVTPFTCMMTASVRAAETRRPDAICNDPFAEALAGEAGRQLAAHVASMMRRENQLQDYVAVRTRYIDDTLDSLDVAIKQVVILGAGLDSRAYRLKALGDRHVYEVDGSTEMLDRKRRILSEMNAPVLAKEHRIVVADLAEEAWKTELINNGFNPKEQTFWLMEGLLPYIDYEGNAGLVKAIDSLSAPGSQIWVDILGPDLVQKTPVQQTKGEGIWRTRAAKYGEANPHEGVLSLINWDLHIAADFAKATEYFGREWIPHSYTSSQGEEKVVPMFFVLATKPASP